MIRILIVDDSVTQREILRDVLEVHQDFAVAAEVRDGMYAVEMVKKYQPDVVLMDIHMPTMDGVEATRQIMDQCPVPVVIVSSALRIRDIDHGLAALDAGAVAILQKPTGAALLNLKKIGPELRETIVAASRAKVKRRNAFNSVAESGSTESADSKASVELNSVEVVAICTSTGGPPVLVEILSLIPKPFPLPVLVVQHIAEPFIESFANWLANRSGQTVRIAGDAQLLEPGVWLAPAGTHLSLGSRRRIKLLPRTATDFHCPSGDPLFSSVARWTGRNAIGVQLTGMGDDGARGLLELKQVGAHTVIQDEASSLIYGMPKAAKSLGAATEELSPSEIASLLSRVAHSRT